MIVSIPDFNGIGVYKITNTATGRVYIGSSVNCNARLKKHSKYPQNKEMAKDAEKGVFIAEIVVRFPNGCTGRQLWQAERELYLQYRESGKAYNHISHSPLHNYRRGNIDDYIYPPEPKPKKTHHKPECDRVYFATPKGKRAIIQAHAERRGESTNAFINRAIDEAMARDAANEENGEG